MAKPKTIELPATISQAIYDHLKKAIIRGELKPGQRVQEKEIAALFEVSSTPVREAFFRLAAEKFLTITARKEVLVQETSDAQVMELYEVVRALDGHAMKKVVRELTDHDLEKFRLMTMKLGEYYEAGDHQRYLEQNLKIHDRLWQVCGNKYLYAALVQLMEKIAIYRKHSDFVPFADAGAMEKSYRDHRLIQEALDRRDLDGLEKVIETHWGEEFIKPLESRAKEPGVETP
jgi:DNA-binding GntR family transcriptional regulator